MMKKFLIVLMTACALFVTVKVQAEEDGVCASTLLSELRSEAANVKVTYVTGDEVVTVDEDPEIGAASLKKHYVYLQIFNINDRMAVRVIPQGKGISGNPQVFGPTHVNQDGIISLKQEALNANVDYQFEIYSLYGACAGRTLRTTKLTVPKFNIYSELDICSDVPDYYLCTQYTSYSIDSATVYDRINDYKEQLANGNIDEANKNKTENNVNKVVSSISKYRFLIVGIIVAIGVVITVIIVKRKKSVL